MKTIHDLPGMSTSALGVLLKSAEGELAARRRERREALRDEIKHIAKAHGYQVREIFPELVHPPRKRPVKFRDPLDDKNAWTGIGRTPLWVRAILDDRRIDLATFRTLPEYRAKPGPGNGPGPHGAVN